MVKTVLYAQHEFSMDIVGDDIVGSNTREQRNLLWREIVFYKILKYIKNINYYFTIQ